MANSHSTSLRSRMQSPPWASPTVSAARAGAGLLSVWFLRTLTVASIGYIVSSQGMMNLAGYSLLGIVFAVLLLALVIVGRLVGTFRFKSLGWVWVSAVFVGFCLVRALPETGGDWPMDALFHLASAFVGGIGVGLALQAGVPFKAIVWALTITNLANIGAGFFGIGTQAPDPDRFAGLTGNANELALQLTLGACLIWISPRKAGALAGCLAVGAVGYAFINTGSRKLLLMAPVFLFLVLFQLAYGVKKRNGRLAVVLIGLVLLLCVGLAPMILERSKNVATVQRALTYENNHSYNIRVDMVHQAIRFWQASPVLGMGTDAFRRISGYGMYAHNNYAELLCDLGVLGTLLFYGIHFYILFKCLRLAMPLKLYCMVFVVMLLVLDMGAVSYYRKQTVMILMILASVAVHPASLIRERLNPRKGQRTHPTEPYAPVAAQIASLNDSHKIGTNRVA